MAKVIFTKSGYEEEVPDGSGLQGPCEKMGIPFACSEGVCGTCIIEIAEGMENLWGFTSSEEDFLGDLDTERLACQCKIKGGTVKINH